MYTELFHSLLFLFLFLNLFYFLFSIFIAQRTNQLFQKNQPLLFLFHQRKENSSKTQKNPFQIFGNGRKTKFSFSKKTKKVVFGKKFLFFFKAFARFFKKKEWLFQNQKNVFSTSLEFFLRKKTNLFRLGKLKKMVSWIFSLLFLIFTCSFYATISNYICSDFTIFTILTNSTADVPTFYKISATWSNHEGSLLLWCWLLSLSCFLFSSSVYENQIFDTAL